MVELVDLERRIRELEDRVNALERIVSRLDSRLEDAEDVTDEIEAKRREREAEFLGCGAMSSE